MSFRNLIVVAVGAASWFGPLNAARAQCACDGDLDGSGLVQITDIILAYECANGNIPPDDPRCDLADVNCDGLIDTCDMSRVWCYFIGLTDCCFDNSLCGSCCGDGMSLLPCEFVSEGACTGFLMNGTFNGGGTTCDPTPCECLVDADCEDGLACTADVCAEGAVCENNPVANGTPCDDGSGCSGPDSCQFGVCTSPTPVDCNDENDCTIDECVEPNGFCEHSPISCNNDGVCDDPCESTETCPSDCPCAATRDLSDASQAYCPTTSKTVHIALNVPSGTNAIGLEDVPPVDWTQVSNISDGGSYDAANHKVKWGPLLAPFPSELTYDVVATSAAQGVQCFDGVLSVDGINEPVCGDECIEEQCCGFAGADNGASSCEGCGDCTCATCGDGRVELCEMIGYACAWKNGCNDDLAGMTRAAFIWVDGECYCWDESVQNWFPVACGGSSGACCTEGGVASSSAMEPPVAVARASRVETRATRSTRTKKRDRSGHMSSIRISIDVAAPRGASVMALEWYVQKGATVGLISDDGVWDAGSRKIKWGPFFDELSRTVTADVTGPVKLRGVRELTGAVSVDGVNRAIVWD